MIQRKCAEEALRESEESFRAIVSNTPDYILMQDRDLRYSFVVNPQLGLTEADMVGKTDRDILGKEESENLTAIKRKVLETGKPFHLEVSLKNLKGKSEFFDGSYVPKFDSAGKADGLIGYFRNITERKQAEEALRNREGMLQRIFDILPVGLWIADKDGKLLRGNPAGVKIWGAEPKVDPSEYGVFKGRRLPSGEEVAPGDWALVHTIRDKVTIVDELLEIDAFDGKKKTILNYSAAVLDAQGDVQGAIVVNQDITERQQAEKEIQSLARFPSENPNPILRIARDCTLLYVNQAGLRLLPDENLHVGQPGPPLMCEVVLQSINDGTSRRLDLEQSGQTYSYIVVPIVAAGYANLYGRNVTDRRKAEHELLQSHEQLRALTAYLESAREDERTRIARELHDELGQVLTALKIDLDWIIRRMQKDDVAGRAKANVMRGLIDDTIDTVRRISSQLRPGLLDDMGLAAAMEWQTREFAERAGLEYEMALDEKDIVLDKELTTALFRIFQESLTNVVRHAGATRIRVSLDVGPDELTMRIKDNGKGITDGQVADPKSLGLTGMRERIRPWGGIVMFRGAAGQGTTVTVRVPHLKSPSGGAP